MKEYKVTGPAGLETTVQLSDEDARKRGLTSKDVVSSIAGVDPDINTVGVDAKAATAENKAATAPNKAAGAK